MSEVLALFSSYAAFMHAVALRVDIRIPLVNSLKEKRRIIKRLESGLRSKFEVAVAEVDFQNQHRRAALGLALVSGESFQLRKICSAIERWLYEHPEIEVLSIELGHLVPE